MCNSFVEAAPRFREGLAPFDPTLMRSGRTCPQTAAETCVATSSSLSLGCVQQVVATGGRVVWYKDGPNLSRFREADRDKSPA